MNAFARDLIEKAYDVQRVVDILEGSIKYIREHEKLFRDSNVICVTNAVLCDLIVANDIIKKELYGNHR